MDIRIIEISPKYWEQYKELKREASTNEPLAFLDDFESTLDLHDDKWIKHLNGEQNSQKTSIVLFAVKNSLLIGIIAGYVNNTPNKKHIAYFASAYVKPEYREKGVASQLIEELFSKIRNYPQVAKIELEVISTLEPALRFFKQHGFVQVGLLKKHYAINNQFFDVILMEKLF